jgi:DNA-binding SARP family transcriptional activator
MIALEADVTVDVHELSAVAAQVFDGTMDGLALTRDLNQELLPEWSDDWVTVERERLRQLELHVLEAGIVWFLAEHRDGDAVDLAHRAIQLEPLRESSHRALIQCHLTHGNRSEALAQFRRLEHMLQDELGLAPEDATRNLVRPLIRSTSNGRSGARRHGADP